MFVELTITHKDQDYFIKGTADIKTVEPVRPTNSNDLKTLEDVLNLFTWTKIIFKTRSIMEMVQWQKPLFAQDKCILKVDGEVYEGVYKTHSRIDGSPIIFLPKQIDFENK